jgi:hypothetical protein
VSRDVTEAWTKACKQDVADVRALVLQIERGSWSKSQSKLVILTVRRACVLLSLDEFVLKSTIPPSGSFRDDISLLPTDAKICATYIYRTDEKMGNSGWHWVLITFVPDHAGVRFR